MRRVVTSLANCRERPMKQSTLFLWLTRFSWGLILLNVVLIFIMPTTINDSTTLILVYLYAVWLIITCILASTWLIIYYRNFFQHWPIWMAMLILMILSSLAMQGIKSDSFPHLSLFAAVLFMTTFWDIGVSTAVLLWRRDVGLRLVAGWTIIIIWALTLSWRIQGNLIELWLSSLNHSGEMMPLWWLNTLFCASCWIVPIGLIGFVAHTLRLIIREYR